MLKQAKILYFITVLLFIANSLTAQYNGGTGTETDPYQIATLENLRTLSLTAAHWNKYFILTADIDASDTQNWDNGSGYLPIGNSDTTFTGSFDGGGHTICDLFIHRAITMVGFFGVTKGGVIKNLTIDSFDIEGAASIGTLVGSAERMGSRTTEISNINITNCLVKGGSWVGGLSGYITAGTINNCHVSGAIYATSGGIGGGLAGLTYSAYGIETVINNCSATVEVFGSANIGGLVGENKVPISNCRVFITVENTNGSYGFFGGLVASNTSTIENCYTSGEIVINGINRNYIGGIVAHNKGTIKNCYSNVAIVAPDSDNVGGLAGKNEMIVKNCYTFGPVTGKNGVGGISGINTDGSQTTDCYATGEVTGENTTGGFVGENGYFATITNCYATGEVNCDEWFAGGFAGLNRSTANTVNCFFDIETTGKTNGIGMNHNGQNQQVVNLTTAEFNNQSTFVNAGWSFGNTTQNPWKMGTATDGYKRPVLFYHNYIVRFEANEGGILEPDSLLTQTVNCGSNTDTIHAIPNEGYYFVKWQSLDGDSITNYNPLVVENVISDSILVAVFNIIDDIEETLVKHVKVYPNPANAVVNLEMDAIFIMENTTIEIIDIHGKTVLKLNPVSVSLHFDVKHFDRGLYIVKIHYDNTFITRKIIIQ